MGDKNFRFLNESKADFMYVSRLIFIVKLIFESVSFPDVIIWTVFSIYREIFIEIFAYCENN